MFSGHFFRSCHVPAFFQDSNLKQNEAAMRAILVKAETDTDEWVPWI